MISIHLVNAVNHCIIYSKLSRSREVWQGVTQGGSLVLSITLLFRFSLWNKSLEQEAGKKEVVFYKKGVLTSFAKFTREHLCQILFFNKVLLVTLLKRRLWQQVFSCGFSKISKNTFFYRTPPVAASIQLLVALAYIYQISGNIVTINNFHVISVKTFNFCTGYC